MKRQIVVIGSDAFVTLTKGFTAVIDAADIPLVDGYNWYAFSPNNRRAVYAVRKGSTGMLYLHRVILGQTDPLILVDHKDGDGLNCRRGNLRLCSNSENLCNRGAQRGNASGYKGVSWHAIGKKWVAQITVSGKVKYLGLFETPEKAHLAYCEAAQKYHGAFARTA